MSVKFVATIAGVNGPVGKDKQEAVVRLREYMESHIGKRHFQETNPDCDEQQYQETLWKLYGREEINTFTTPKRRRKEIRPLAKVAFG